MKSLDSYAVVKVGGQQVLARPREWVRVARRPDAVGKKVTLDEVLLVQQDKQVSVGRPTVKGAQVVCEVKGHGREPKIIVYKFKRRKNVRRKQGHRQNYTDLWIKEIKTGT